MYCELFPTRVRYTALSVGYNIPVAIFGGFTPFIPTWLTQSTGNLPVPGLLRHRGLAGDARHHALVKETAFEPLP